MDVVAGEVEVGEGKAEEGKVQKVEPGKTILTRGHFFTVWNFAFLPENFDEACNLSRRDTGAGGGW